MAKDYEIQWRRSFKRELKVVIRNINFSRGIKNAKKAVKARSRLKTIARVLFWELKRKLPAEALQLQAVQDKLDIFSRILNQRKNDKNKIYSLHEA